MPIAVRVKPTHIGLSCSGRHGNAPRQRDWLQKTGEFAAFQCWGSQDCNGNAVNIKLAEEMPPNPGLTAQHQKNRVRNRALDRNVICIDRRDCSVACRGRRAGLRYHLWNSLRFRPQPAFDQSHSGSGSYHISRQRLGSDRRLGRGLSLPERVSTEMKRPANFSCGAFPS